MPELQPLFAEYRGALLANGYEESKEWPYTFGRFSSGREITDYVRSYYRASPEKWEVYGDPFSSASLEFFERKGREPIRDLGGFLKVARRRIERFRGGKAGGGN
jgi:hypothetical protein